MDTSSELTISPGPVSGTMRWYGGAQSPRRQDFVYMNLTFSDEHEQLRASVRAFLRHHHTFEAHRAALKTGKYAADGLWRAMAQQLGLIGLSLPEHAGGLDLDAVHTMIVMEELGRALVPVPFLETTVVCGALLARAGGAKANELLPRIVAGDFVLCFAAAEVQTRIDWTEIETRALADAEGWQLDGHKVVVIAAPWASHLLVTARTSGRPGDRAGLSLFMVERSHAGLVIDEYPTVDGRVAADISFASVRLTHDALIGEEGDAIESLEQVADDAVVAVCAEAIGVLERMLEETLAYAKQRRQFGQPLTHFQVLQHRMVDMYMSLEQARSAVLLACLKLNAPAHERALAVSAAKVVVNDACRFVGQGAIQIHGGMGMTDELAVGHLFKRATVIEREWGSSDAHVTRHAQLSRQYERRGL